MRALFGIAAGFLFVPSILGVGAFWVWAMTAFQIAKSDFLIGAVSAMAILIIGFAVAVKYS